MTRARDVADTQDNLGGAVAPWVGGKNAVINGGMDIWQRGTSRTYTVGPSYTADRFSFNCSAVTSVTISQITTSDTTNLPNIYNAMRIQRTAGNTSTPLILIQDSIESRDSYRFAGQQIAFSFWARKGSNFSVNTFTVQVISGTGTDQSLVSGFTGSNAVIDSVITPTTTWQRFTATATVPASATQLGFQFFWSAAGTAGANDFLDITGIQLETGSAATPFARAGGSVGSELALCQRYYEIQDWPINTYRPAVVWIANDKALTWVSFLVQKRVAPTISFTGNPSFRYISNNGAALGQTLVALGAITTQGTSVGTNGTFSLVGAGWIDGGGTSGYSVIASAEL